MRGLITQDLQLIIELIRQGGVVAYPTEAVFGLGCDPSNLTAVQRILAIKQRSANKGLILIAAEFEQFQAYIPPLDHALREKILATWPGAVTWVLPTYPHVSPLLRGQYQTLAVRVTDHPTVRTLCQQLGHPLVSTSANLSGEQPLSNAQAIANAMGQQVDAIVDLALGGRANPSEIRDGATGKIIRPS